MRSMNQRFAVTAQGRSSLRLYGVLARLFLFAMALSLAAACASVPATEPTPDADAAAPAAMPTPTPDPAPDADATARAGLQANSEAMSTSTPDPTPDGQTTDAQAPAQAIAAATPTPTPTPNAQAVAQATATATATPTPAPTPDTQAVAQATATATATPTPTPTPDTQAVAQATATATATPTPAPTPDTQAVAQATATATPTPTPTPNAQATAQARARATAEVIPTPTDTPVPTPTAVPAVTAKPAASHLPPAFPVDPATVVPAGSQLHDPQEITVPDGIPAAAPWRDGGKQRILSMWVYGTVYQIDKSGTIRPYIGIGHEVNDDNTVWTVKLREDAVFQDGTPVTAADFKYYWEHGAKPENIVAWGGASHSLQYIKGWDPLRAGDVLEAEGLVAIDDHTLQITTAVPFPTWPLWMAAWHTGISKLDQVLSDEQFSTRPIGAGPYKLTIENDRSGWPEPFVAEADAAAFWGPSPNIKRLRGLNVEDPQARTIMFENGELDLMRIDSATYEAALDPSHSFNRLLKITPYAGLYFIKNFTHVAPLEDVLVRKALAHGADMRSIVNAVWGVTGNFATGIISPLTPCHNRSAQGHVYDPDLARQELAQSSYGGADKLPTLMIDLNDPEMIEMGLAIKDYWKDTLGIEFDVLERTRGVPRRQGTQFFRLSLGVWIPDPIQIVSTLTQRDSIEGLRSVPGGYPVLDRLVEHARSLPLDHPERCAAFRAVEEEYMDQVQAMPIRWVGGVKWVVQPWVVGFESTSNIDINTMPWMYILKH